MEYHQKSIRVTASDLDELQHVNNVRYLEWIQDISKEHWEMKAPAELQDQLVWVVLCHKIEYKKAAFLDEEIEVRTHVARNHGVISQRVVEFSHPERGLLVRSSTDWCLLNATTMKPMRVPDTVKHLFPNAAD